MKFLFVIDPIKNINPLKDSTAALMQASSKKKILKSGVVLLKTLKLEVTRYGHLPEKLKSIRGFL